MTGKLCFKIIVLLYLIMFICLIYTDTANDLSTNNNATNDIVVVIEFDELFSAQSMDSASQFLNSGKYKFFKFH